MEIKLDHGVSMDLDFVEVPLNNKFTSQAHEKLKLESRFFSLETAK
jgi:hypothetical protein